MRKFGKRLCAAALTMVLALGFVPYCGMAANAEEPETTEEASQELRFEGRKIFGDFEVCYLEKDGVVIYNYFGDATDLVIPWVMGDVYHPTDIYHDGLKDNTNLVSLTFPEGFLRCFHPCPGCTNLEVINFPSTMWRIEMKFYELPSLREINVAPGSNIYKSDNGALYCTTTLDGTYLLACPCMKTELKILDNTSYVAGTAFSGCKQLTSLTVPASLHGRTVMEKNEYRREHFTEGLKESACLMEVNIDEGNSNYKSVDGVVYTINEQPYNALLFCPRAKESVVIPDRVKEIAANAVVDCPNLTSLTIPKSVTKIDDKAISGCDKLTIYGVKGSTAETYASEKGIPFEEIPDEKPIETPTKTSIAGCELSIGPSDKLVYTGKALCPSVKVSDGQTILAEGVDYTVTYSDNTEVGYAKACVEGIGKYEGTLDVSFSIVPEKQTIKKLSAASKGFKVSWKKAGSKTVTGYQVQYAVKSNMKGAKRITVKPRSAVSKSVKKLKAKKKYYVQVRSYCKVEGRGTLYGTWSKKKTVTTKK